ncbi:MAG TPA: hypothetical protein VMT28_15040 [Terriglobales bacterium]|jgi:hypothetical protein|nr:hypothetical protein [Terriglobales bacterium]
MTTYVKSFFLSAALAAMMLPAAAQSNSPAATPPTTEPPVKQDKATIGQRKENQQDRIANGVKSGELTAGESGRLEKEESKLNAETREMREDNGGKLTPAEKARVTRQQNRLSRQIYRQKHDAQTQNTNPKTLAGKRAENQQDRIGQGVASGQLTSGEATRLERNEARIHHEAKDMREDNGGKLTPADKAKINRQQTRESHRIYRAKHNGRHQ